MSSQIVVKIQLDASQLQVDLGEQSEVLDAALTHAAKLRDRRDRWRKRAEDAERAIEGAMKVNEMYVGAHLELQRARDEVVKLRQMLAAARNTIADLQQARDAALLDLNLATAKVGASARARDALMRENGELRAELDAAFRRAPGVGGWVIVARRDGESIEDALRKSLSDIASNATPR